MQNENVEILSTELLSDNWYVLKKVTFKYTNTLGETQIQSREAYDRGNGAVILLYNKSKETVVLIRQFRLPTYINGNTDGMLIEACAGLLDKDKAEDCIRRETEEEAGFRIKKVEKVFEAYMSPGSVTEILHFFIAEYSDEMRVSEGGGVLKEQENIEVLELPFIKALSMIDTGEIKDAKTIMLLQFLRIRNIF